MSSEQAFSTSDLRSTAQGNKRATASKYKWQFGASEGLVSRGPNNPRPFRPCETAYTARRRKTKAAVAYSAAKVACRRDRLDDTTVSDDSSSSNSDFDEGTPSPPPDAGVMYSFDAPCGPSHGSHILNVALAKAVERFEEKETAKLVKNEYEILDSEGESVGLMPSGKGKGRAKEVAAVLDEDEDYEFV